MMRCFLLPFVLAATCSAQTSPSFAVATVKPAPEGTAANGRWTAPGVGSFSARSVTLALLLQLAYDINDAQIANKPPWLETALYDVDAKPEPGVRLSRDELKTLLQNLLHERFHMQVHEAVEQQTGYAMVIAKGGVKFASTTSDKRLNFRVLVNSGHIEGLNWTMSFLAMQVANAAGSPVVDQTGMTGGYDLKLIFAPGTATDSTLPALFTAIQEQLGLRLQPQKVPVTMLVLDHVERTPIEN